MEDIPKQLFRLDTWKTQMNEQKLFLLGAQQEIPLAAAQQLGKLFGKLDIEEEYCVKSRRKTYPLLELKQD